MSLLAIQDITLGYEGKNIVEDLIFEVNSGNYLCIVGENGSGKSTLIKTILGLTPAIAGKITFDEGLKQNEIGYLPQQTLIQRDFPAAVHEIVLSGCLNRVGMRPFYRKKEKQLAQQTMDRLHIRNLEKSCYRDLSGGQQQRVLLARALCATRKMLLLDEPVAGLDPNATNDLYATINELNGQDNITVVMVSHDISSALAYASHILHIGNRSALFFGTVEKYQESGLARRLGATQEVTSCKK